MTIDRENIRRLYNLPTSQARAAVFYAVPDLLDELERLERELKFVQLAPVPGSAPNVERAWEAYDTMRTERNDLSLRLQIATELNVADRKRIAELEAETSGLRGNVAALRAGNDELRRNGEEQVMNREQRIAELEDALARAVQVLYSVPDEHTRWNAAFVEELDRVQRGDQPITTDRVPR